MWGFDGVVLTPRLYKLNVGFVVFMLHLIPFVLMNIFLFKQYKWLKKFSANDLIILFLIAFFGGALGTLSIVKALFLVQFQHLSVVVLLQKLQPIFAVSLAAFILKEKITKKFALWAAVAVIASYFLTFGLHLPHHLENTPMMQAALWAVLAAFSFGSSTVLSKKILTKYTYYTATFYRFGFTSFLMLIYVLLIGKMTELSNVTPNHWLYFMIISVTTGSGALFIYYSGLRKVRAMVATICELFFPISAIMFDFLINKQVLSTIQWISAAVMVFAVIQVSSNRKLGR